jgi:hypothetical protein
MTPGVTLFLSVRSSCSAAKRIWVRAFSGLPLASVIHAVAVWRWIIHLVSPLAVVDLRKCVTQGCELVYLFFGNIDLPRM